MRIPRFELLGAKEDFQNEIDENCELKLLLASLYTKNEELIEKE